MLQAREGIQRFAITLNEHDLDCPLTVDIDRDSYVIKANHYMLRLVGVQYGKIWAIDNQAPSIVTWPVGKTS